VTAVPQVASEHAAQAAGEIEVSYYQPARQRYATTAIGTVSVVAFFVLWELVARLELVSPMFISSPLRILKAGSEMVASGEIWTHLAASYGGFAVGFGIAVLVGVPIGMISGWYDKIFAAVNPFVVGLNATPRVALMPLLVIWLGIGLGSKVAIVFLGAVFPIIFNMMTGMRTLDASLLKAARSFGATDFQIFRTLAFPSSIPFLISGLRLGAGRGLVGIVIGELYASNVGVGYLIAYYGSSFQTDKLFVGVMAITFMGITLDVALRKLEARFESWRPQR
jgi:NitT/TauT family transport system permease protein